jgi:hypothetical protein
MAPIKPFREPDHRGERANGAARRALQRPVSLVGFLGFGLPVVARDQRDDLDFLRLEAPQVSVLD